MSENKPRKVGARAARNAVPGPGRPKDLAKRKAILEAAKSLFPRYGYDRISMDAIAAEAGVSKLTVYSHFKDKNTLFAAAVKARCEEQLPSRAFAMPTASVPIAAVLTTIAERFHALACSPDAMEMYRTMAARAPASDNLAQIFFDAGPKRTIDALEQLLRKAHRAGKLNVPEPRTSAEHFFVLVKGLAHMCALIGCAALPQGEATAAHIRSVVDLFVRAHEPVETPQPPVRKRARQRSS
ncbi:MAG: TetR family transcriptional regulator [Gammaproteobacteria bacterium HGW-Gammaproteobacteria-2]|jgi:TetR/AcrR family transcriptional repressor of mexJK operon|nr:MAG: TetR family transcriptional regulator [Gammaproteobacteria bacterium HGW-Gammaproteobacteria-2]